MYLDDGFGTCVDKDDAVLISSQIKQDLIESGFVPKVEKSTWYPVQNLVWFWYLGSLGIDAFTVDWHGVNGWTHSVEIQELPECFFGKIHLVTDLLEGSKANSTVLKYSRGFMRGKRWATKNGISDSDILPAKSLQVALYLSGIIQESNTPSTLISAFYSLKWAHDLADLDSPTNSSLVKNILESGKRKLSKPVNKKEPITKSQLINMYERLICSI
ncbi:hypothetical protein LOTGIDRAFT_157151 [Lottia gigantea]|uniref:Uncharacterized protein n=1 Tax=Lottia gigantea TaxID=225164 RepID=V4ADD5_LOTGI|nr:hypothetical protein LOTGIDRAFT_157151 [Lottia gigantea]ESP02019.1 hypothetical protein LOTGIDRAFT_157151 [Lottia gigantea]